MFRSAFAATLVSLLLVAASSAAQSASSAPEDSRFSWKASGPLIDVGSGKDAPDPHVAIKDPTLVFHGGRWHLFTTVRMKSGRVDIEYLSFTDWSRVGEAPRHVLALHDQYYCAPQVFYFTPHRKWYLVFQLAEKTRTPPFGPCFSTSEDLADPTSWSKPLPMVADAPEKPQWLDFWVICDAEKAHLYYTSLDGHLWRRETNKSEFPSGWSEQQLALEADIFEASHTYKIKGRDQYLTIVEALNGGEAGDGRRYYKAYLADRLEGPWKGLADTLSHPFAAYANVQQDVEWTTNVSHGEIIRTGVDETMEVDLANLRFVFQGASDIEYRGQNYAGIPWRLGMLERTR